MQKRGHGHPSRKGETEQVFMDRQTPRDNDSQLCSRLCPLACGPTRRGMHASAGQTAVCGSGTCRM